LSDIKGVLVHGPVGIGKSLLISHVLATIGKTLSVVKVTPA
jgi:MoxR-like ATPase